MEFMMFKNETLFILGAGSSKPYGYPLGKELVRDIINNIKNDQILLPRLPKITEKYYWNENDGKIVQDEIIHGYDLYDFFEHFNKIDSLKFTETASPPHTIYNGRNNYYSVKIIQINEFFKLFEAVKKFDPISIDTFLRDHPAYVQAGKIIIIYSLLKCENKSKFYLDKPTENDGSDNWYSFLINDLLSGCNKPEDILNNKLNILNFNYDLSLDYYLKNNLSETGFLKNNAKVSKYINSLITEHTFHVYGKLYDEDPIKVYGHYKNNKNSDVLPLETLHTKRFIKSLQSHESIKSMYQKREKTNNIYRELISKAEVINIIGFGFDRDNLNICELKLN